MPSKGLPLRFHSENFFQPHLPAFLPPKPPGSFPHQGLCVCGLLSLEPLPPAICHIWILLILSHQLKCHLLRVSSLSTPYDPAPLLSVSLVSPARLASALMHLLGPLVYKLCDGSIFSVLLNTLPEPREVGYDQVNTLLIIKA